MADIVRPSLTEKMPWDHWVCQVTYVRAATLTSSDITGVPVRESEGEREKVEQEALEIKTAEEFPCLLCQLI